MFSFVFLLLSSCDVFNNYGYPHKVNFNSRGGERIVSGNEVAYNICISNYNGDILAKEEQIAETDTFLLTYEWLTVKYRRLYESNIIINADPNVTGKSRHCYIDLGIMDSGATIKVTQN